MTTTALQNRPEAEPAVMNAPNPQTESRLFSLPPELRVKIYSYLFATALNKDGRITMISSFYSQPPRPTVLSILQTCKLIRNEAEDLFYSAHTLEFSELWMSADHPKGILVFLHSLKIQRLAAVRSLCLYFGSVESITTFCRAAKRLTGLRSLSVHIGGEYARDVGIYLEQKIDRETTIIRRAAKHLSTTLETFEVWVFGPDTREWGEDGGGDKEVKTKATEALEIAVMQSIKRRRGD